MFIGKHEIAGKACIMGILNVTPDSFSDGGDFDTIEDALAQVERMISQGASIIDVGGESTRPGAEFVTEEEEIARIVPIIQAIKEKYDVLISIDTYKTATARAALEGGVAVMLTSSGQAANFYAIFNICQAGDHFVCSSAIYGGTFNLFGVTMKKLGIEVTFVSPKRLNVPP